MNILKRIRRRMMLSCEDVNEFLAAYLDDDLPARTRRRFEKHLAKCEVCSAYLDQYQSTIMVTREAQKLDHQPPDALVEMTMSFLREQWDKESASDD